MPNETYTFASTPGEPGGPALFLFHGTGGDEDQLVSLGRDLAPDAAIVSPRGDVSEYGAARFFRRTGEGVYDMDDLARATAKMTDFVRRHAAGADKVFGLGYSNGANILASTLFAAPDLFDAAVLMHPLIPFQPKVKGRLDGKRIVITAGRYDPICPPHLTARLEAHLRAVGADVMVVWHDGGHEIRGEELQAVKTALGQE